MGKGQARKELYFYRMSEARKSWMRNRSSSPLFSFYKRAKRKYQHVCIEETQKETSKIWEKTDG